MVDKTVDRFSECGIFHHGFARIRCPECREEYLLAFSCKTRYFCPSCQAKRVAAFVEWITGEILQEVPHRQLVWTIRAGGFPTAKSVPGAEKTPAGTRKNKSSAANFGFMMSPILL